MTACSDEPEEPDEQGQPELGPAEPDQAPEQTHAGPDGEGGRR
jgi:hypothetical protein